MSTEVLVAPLRQVALFEGLTPQQLLKIARSAERIVFKPGDKIIQDGRDAGGALILVAGEAELLETEGDAANVPPGSMLAEMAMFIDTESSATVVARSQVRALRLDREAMLAEMATDPSLADYFVERISARLKGVADELRKVDRTLAGDGPIDVNWSDVDPGNHGRGAIH